MMQRVVADRNMYLNLKCNTLLKPNSSAVLRASESGGDLCLVCETTPDADWRKVQLQKCSRASAEMIVALKRHVKKN